MRAIYYIFGAPYAPFEPEKQDELAAYKKDVDALLWQGLAQWKSTEGMYNLGLTRFAMVDQERSGIDSEIFGSFLLTQSLTYGYEDDHWWTAVGDPRFESIAAAELADLRIEVSLLGPFRPIAPDEVEVGRHGLMIRRQGRSGLLLPQVAREHRWSGPRFLEELCRKAGLPPGAWRDPAAELLGFEAEIHAEREAS